MIRFFAFIIFGLIVSISQANALQSSSSEKSQVQDAPTEAKTRSSQNTQATNDSTITNDFTLPVTANSKNQSLDAKNRISIFIDDVVIRQGSLQILADRVEANAQAGKGKEIITAKGSPATYTQRLEDGSVVSASANEIIYAVESQTISLNGNAAITQNDVSMNGNNIAFDMAKERIMASTDEGSSDIVTTVLSPGAFKSEDQQEREDKDDQPNDTPGE